MTQGKKLQQEYQERNKTVKKKTKRDKKTYVEKLANEAEIAARQNNSRELYKITRQLAGKNKSTSPPSGTNRETFSLRNLYNYSAGKNISKIS